MDPHSFLQAKRQKQLHSTGLDDQPAVEFFSVDSAMDDERLFMNMSPVDLSSSSYTEGMDSTVEDFAIENLTTEDPDFWGDLSMTVLPRSHFLCPELGCGQSLRRPRDFFRHLDEKHSSSKICPFRNCDFNSKRLARLRTHLANEHRVYSREHHALVLSLHGLSEYEEQETAMKAFYSENSLKSPLLTKWEDGKSVQYKTTDDMMDQGTRQEETSNMPTPSLTVEKLKQRQTELEVPDQDPPFSFETSDGSVGSKVEELDFIQENMMPGPSHLKSTGAVQYDEKTEEIEIKESQDNASAEPKENTQEELSARSQKEAFVLGFGMGLKQNLLDQQESERAKHDMFPESNNAFQSEFDVRATQILEFENAIEEMKILSSKGIATNHSDQSYSVESRNKIFGALHSDDTELFTPVLEGTSSQQNSVTLQILKQFYAPARFYYYDVLQQQEILVSIPWHKAFSVSDGVIADGWGEILKIAWHGDLAISHDRKCRVKEAIREYDEAILTMNNPWLQTFLSTPNKQTKETVKKFQQIMSIYEDRVEELKQQMILEESTKLAGSTSVASQDDRVILDTETEEDNQSNISANSGNASLISVADSVFSILSASSMSSAVISGPQGAVDRLVSLLLGDTDIKPLCAEGIYSIAPTRFERNLRRLLKEFAVALRNEAETAEQRQAAHFVRYRSRNTAHIICNKINKTSKLLENRPTQLMSTQVIIDEDMEQGDISGDSSDSDRDEDATDNLQQLEIFILNSLAIKLLRERLRNFVRPPVSTLLAAKGKIKETRATDNILDALSLPNESGLVEEASSSEQIAKNEASLMKAARTGNSQDQASISALRAKKEAPEISINGMSDLLDDSTTEINTINNLFPTERPFMETLKERMKRGNQWSTSFINDCIAPLFPGYMPPMKPGQTRIEMICKCGQRIIDDYTEHTPGGIARFRGSLINFSTKPEKKGYFPTIAESKERDKLKKTLGYDSEFIEKKSRRPALIIAFWCTLAIELMLCFTILTLGQLSVMIIAVGIYHENSLVTRKVSDSKIPDFGNDFKASPETANKFKPTERMENIQTTNTNSETSSQASTNTTGSSFMSIFKGMRSTFSFRSTQSSDSERGLPFDSLPTSNPSTETTAPDLMSPPPPELLFLLLCYPSGRYATRLLQLDLHSLNAKCDQSLFSLLRSNYLSMRRSVFSLKRLKSIKFVRFEMYQSELVDVRKTDDVPPPDHIDYRYMPTPLDVVPPVGEGLMMHLFTHPTHASSFPHLLSRLPKKLHKPLIFQPANGIHPSWGLQYLESWDVAKLWCITFGLFGGGSLLWGVLWAVYGKSVQDAFAVSAYIVAMVGVFGGTSQALLMM